MLFAFHSCLQAINRFQCLQWNDISWAKWSWKRQWNPYVESGERIQRLSAQVKPLRRWVFYPTSWTIEHEHIPLKYYKILKSRHPNESESAFYFAIKHQQNPGENIWTNKSVFGNNVVWKPLLKAAQNYSVPKTCISKLLHLYQSASFDLKQRMLFTLSRLANVLATSEFP